MRSTQPRLGLMVLIGICALAEACSTPAGGSAAPAAPTESPAPAATSTAPPVASPPASTSASDTGGGRGDYDYGDEMETSPTASPSASIEVRIANGELGDYLTDADGMTLYTFKPDEMNLSTCEAACADAWPPFTVGASGSVAAGEGVGGTLATFERSDGTLQVSYEGAPLYFFARDVVPGDINGHGAGDAWYVAVP